MTKNICPQISNDEQTKRLSKLLHRKSEYFTRCELLELILRLPCDIRFKGERGYLSFGPLGIEYTSVNSDFKVKNVFSSSAIPNKDLYDCFIETLEFFNNNEEHIEILEQPENCIINY